MIGAMLGQPFAGTLKNNSYGYLFIFNEKRRKRLGDSAFHHIVVTYDVILAFSRCKSTWVLSENKAGLMSNSDFLNVILDKYFKIHNCIK